MQSYKSYKYYFVTQLNRKLKSYKKKFRIKKKNSNIFFKCVSSHILKSNVEISSHLIVMNPISCIVSSC